MWRSVMSEITTVPQALHTDEKTTTPAALHTSSAGQLPIMRISADEKTTTCIASSNPPQPPNPLPAGLILILHIFLACVVSRPVISTLLMLQTLPNAN